MDLNELAERLSMLEGANAEAAAANEQKAFIDKYGTQFSGDEGIGMAILAEMNRRGVPSAAAGADRVVQEILDAIRMEATAILDKIKNDQATVSNLMDQVTEIQQSVEAATGAPASGEAEPAPMPPPEAMGPPPVDGAMPPMPPADGMAPPPDAGAPPPDAGAPPPDMPPEASGAPAPPELPPEAVASDERVKTVISDERLKSLRARIQQRKAAPAAPAKPSGWRPPAHLVSAASGGR